MLPINSKCQWPHVKSFSRASSGVSRICCLSQYVSLGLVAAAFRPSERLVWVTFDPTLNLIFAGLSTTVSCVCLSVCLVCLCLIPNLRSRINKIFQTGGCVSFILSVISKNHVFLVICYEQRGLDSEAHTHSAAFKGFSWCCSLTKCLSVLAEFSSQQF